MPERNANEGTIEVPLSVLMAGGQVEAGWRNEKWLHVLLLYVGNDTEAEVSLRRLSEIERKLNEP